MPYLLLTGINYVDIDMAICDAFACSVYAFLLDQLLSLTNSSSVCQVELQILILD